jgi:hypothetical protein
MCIRWIQMELHMEGNLFYLPSLSRMGTEGASWRLYVKPGLQDKNRIKMILCYNALKIEGEWNVDAERHHVKGNHIKSFHIIYRIMSKYVSQSVHFLYSLFMNGTISMTRQYILNLITSSSYM